MWEIDDQTATLRLASLAAQVNLRRAHAGLHNVRVQGKTIPNAEVLQVRIGDTPPDRNDDLVDSYVRGADLVAVYASTTQRNISAQIYWRAIRDEAVKAAGVEIIASVQTDLLDSAPRVAIGGTLPRCDVLRLVDESESRFERIATMDANPLAREAGTGLFLYRLPGTACSYVEMIHPANFAEAQIHACTSGTERLRSEFRLFNEPLEKGVIRRGRVCGMFLAREEDEKAAAECYRGFVQSATPLTA